MTTPEDARTLADPLAQRVGPAYAPGEALGPYRVEKKLAEGAMGEVFQAFDTRLERRVAIKTLPARLGQDRWALKRFERETKALAALSHPNILTIFDVGHARGTAFAVTELLSGSTLYQRIERGKLPIATAVGFAAQAARALAAAHAEGVVHRDLKPENLFITGDGQLKVLDFGIASFTPKRAVEGVPAERLTTEHALIGTVGYMSPEQAQCESCDHRADIFALGAVLYEMLTGTPAFAGKSPLVTFLAVVNDDPPPLEACCPAASPALVKVIARCLAKEPARRFQSASDLAFCLEALVEPAAKRGGELPAGARRPRWQIAALAAATFLAGLALAFWMLYPPRLPTPPRIEALTHTTSDRAPSATPDGRTVAFASERDGRSRIWLQQISTGDERPLTEGIDSDPRLSPDGQLVLFTRDTGVGPGLYRTGLLGGEPQHVVSPARLGAWAPDGRRVAFVRERSEQPHNLWTVGTIALDGSGERLLEPEQVPISHLGWSPDGRFVWAVRRRSAAGTQDDLLRIDVERGNKQVFAAPEAGGQISRPVWIGDGRALLFAQTISVTGYLSSSRVVAFAPASGRSQTLFWYPSAIEAIDALGRDGLIFDAVEVTQSLAAGSVSEGRFGAQRWLTGGTGVDRQPCYTPAGDGLVFSSNRSGNIDLWWISTTTGSLQRLTEDPADDWDPAISPDGRWLVWSSNRGGRFEIHVAEHDGRNPRQLTHGNLAAENPTFTADGAWVVYSADRGEGSGVRRVRLDGSDDQLVAAGGRGHPDVSPDGRWVLVRTHTLNGVAELRVIEIATGKTLPESLRLSAGGLPADRGLTFGRARWLPGGTEVAFVGLAEQGCVALLARGFDPARGLVEPTRTLVDCSPELIPESFAFARDGRLAISFLRRSAHLVTATGLELGALWP